MYEDLNDGGATGWGIVTNEPPFDWQLRAVAHSLWKRSLARPAVGVPGGFYPDERFQRLQMVKTALEDPSAYRAPGYYDEARRRTEGRTEGRKDGRKEGRKEGWMEGRKECRKRKERRRANQHDDDRSLR